MTPMTEDDARLLELANDSSDESDVADDTRCKYPSKYCGNARAAKSSGKLHRFCELHRRRANVNQKRWTAVRRQHAHDSREAQRRTAAMDPLWALRVANYYGMTMPDHFSETTFVQQLQLLPMPMEDVAHKHSDGTTPLSDDDIAILMALLAPGDVDTWPEDDACTEAPHYTV